MRTLEERNDGPRQGFSQLSRACGSILGTGRLVFWLAFVFMQVVFFKLRLLWL